MLEEFAASYEPFPRIGFQITKEPNSTDDLPSKETEQILIQWPELSPLLAKIQPVFFRCPSQEGRVRQMRAKFRRYAINLWPAENRAGVP